jgi:hypothetical protein
MLQRAAGALLQLGVCHAAGAADHIAPSGNLLLLVQVTMSYRHPDLEIQLTTVLVLAALDKRYLCQAGALQADCASHVVSRSLTCSFLSCIALFGLRSQCFVVTDWE